WCCTTSRGSRTRRSPRSSAAASAPRSRSSTRREAACASSSGWRVWMDNCREISRLLDEYVDGTLDDVRARAVRGHLRACAECAAQVASTQKLVDAAAGLGEMDPPQELWQRISTGLDADDQRLAERPRLWWWWQAWGRRISVGAGFALAAAIALVVVWQRREVSLAETLRSIRPPVSPQALYDDALREVERAEAEYVSAVNDLRAIANDERGRWRPEVQKACDEHLAAIDGAIARQAEAARARPGDVGLADALHDSYRKEIDFLQDAVVRGQGQ